MSRQQIRSAIALLLLLVFAFLAQAAGQEERDDGEKIREREQWFLEQRAYPLNFVPVGARYSAMQQVGLMEARRAAAIAHGQVEPAALGQWTLIGPQPTSTPFTDPVVAGRTTALAIDPRDPNVIYVGAAEGGVWKTIDGGTTWVPLTDDQASLAVGSIALAPSNPDIVYVGTGEGNFSGDSYYGAGILKSTDSGATWTQFPGPFVGPFDPTSFFGGGAHIGSLAVHPTNGQILLAAVQLLFKDGIYRSTDGGVNWTLVLAGAPGTGVVFEPTTGNVAYAALGSNFGSTSNGMYKSTDGGQTWVPDNGTAPNVLPSADVGRIALAMAPSAPQTLYVGIQSVSTSSLLGFFKTTDGGTNWSRLPATPDYCAPQCWYDHVIAVQPTNPNVIFAGGAFQITLVRSLDGGATWSTIAATAAGTNVHADVHALTFPPDGSKLYIGNDGGVYTTSDVTLANPAFTQLNDSLAITQFYPGLSISPADVNTTLGGTQDNGTQIFTGGLIWNQVVCGDGGWTAIDPTLPTTMYATCEQISIFKSLLGGDFGTWTRSQTGINAGDRVSFIPPFIMDPSNSLTLYFGTFRVYQTIDGALSWTPISPDLTSGGNHKLTALAVAPSDPNTVYTGSDGGRVQVTRNAGAGVAATWTDRTAGLPMRHLTQIACDPASPTTAYLTFSGFSGFFGDTKGHVFKTTDAAATWMDLSGNLPNIPVNDIVIDPDLSNTLYVATDVGVFQSSDGGANWTPLATGLPRVAVLGLKLHRPTRTLRAATHGRSVWDLTLPAPAAPAL